MPNHTLTCQNCGGELPAGSRSDRKWCKPACQSYAQRRSSGAVAENTGTCSSCGVSLAGMQSNAKLCRSRKCRSWNQRNPGIPHPSTQPRFCAHCKASIDHRNGKAKYCDKACTSAAIIAADREGYNAKARAWQSTEKAKAYRRDYQKANAAKRQQWARENRARDPQRYRQYWKQWAEENTAACRELARIRRARKLGNPDSVGVSLKDWRRLVQRYRGCCAYCGEVAEPLHMDHVIPLARGGRHAIGNVLPACSHCNFTKHAMLLVAWRRRQLQAA